jgi:ornithine decarboxylase
VLYLDVARASAAYTAVAAAVRPIRVRYATKANPHPALLAALVAAGAEFAVTTLPELGALLACGVAGARVACVTPGPPASLLRRCHAAGVRRFAVDTGWELRKLAALAPGAAALVTLRCPPAGRLRYPAAPLGAPLDELEALAAAARALPVELAGVAVHVGSQCERLAPWRAAVALAGAAWQRLLAAGHAPRVLSLGGGLPVRYRQAVPAPATVARAIRSALAAYFPTPPAEVWLEPGRYVAAPAGALVATVLRREARAGRRPRLALDVGRYHGLPEAALGIRYPYRALGVDAGPHVERCVLLGPGGTVDVLDPTARLPQLLPGDRLCFLQAGAYTACQAAYPVAADGPAVRLGSPRSPSRAGDVLSEARPWA